MPDWMFLPDWAVTVILVALLGGVLLGYLVLLSTRVQAWVRRNSLGGFAPAAEAEVFSEEEQALIAEHHADVEEHRAEELAAVDPLDVWFPIGADDEPTPLFWDCVFRHEVTTPEIDGPTGVFDKGWIDSVLERAR